MIIVLSKQELEDKYCIAKEVDCDGDIYYPMDNKQIKECYLENSEHRDLFIQVIEHKIDEMREELDGDMLDYERVIKWGVFIGLESAISTYYNVHKQVDKINNKKGK